MRIFNKTKNIFLADKGSLADSFFVRMKGLLGRRGMASDEALVITRCNSVHTFFMRFPIDVLFLDKNYKVVGLENCLEPWRISPIYWRAKSVVELPAGKIRESRTAKDDEIGIL